MHAPQSLLLKVLLACLSVTATARAPPHFTGRSPPGKVPEPLPCVVPEIALTGLVAPFSLSVLSDSSADTWPITLPKNHSKYGDHPFITSPSGAKSLFRLSKGKLTTGGPNHDKYTAYFGPVLPTFPPPLSELLFGEDDESTRFYGSYACDKNGGLVLVLNADEPLVVRALKNGEEIFGKTQFNEEPTVSIQLEIIQEKSS